MDYHILELKLDSIQTILPLPKGIAFKELNAIPSWPLAESCLLNLQPWTHISLNEGSFLKAYGTYEFFERGPPSLVHSIARAFFLTYSDKVDTGWKSINSCRSFTYTGIFPFSNHARFHHIIPYLEELDVQFAPDPQSGILDDKKRTGKAELQDCWQELVSAYHDIAMTIGTARMSSNRFPKLKKFVCRDMRIAALQEDLDEIFTPLCLPVWAEYEAGVFTRIAMSPMRNSEEEEDMGF